MLLELSRMRLRGPRRAAARWTAVALVTLLIANAPARLTDPAEPVAPLPMLPPEIQKEILRGGEVGFVVTQLAYALGPDAKDSGSCPAGMTGGLRALLEAYRKGPTGQLKTGETPENHEKRLELNISTAPNGQNLCIHPEAGSPDPNWRMVSGRNLRVDGIDLDNLGSSAKKNSQASLCPHEDFLGTRGQRGIDNQFYRVVGCTSGFQSNGQANGWQTEMYTGSWGVLVRLRGVDDLYNDPEVEVGIFANADPIQLSAERKALTYATYAVDQDVRYRAKTRGRIVNGVLTTDAVDVRVHNVVAAMYTDRILRDARLRLSFLPDGGMEGYLAGYSPIDNIFDVQFGARSARSGNGELAPERRRISTSVGRAGALGHTCNGAYYALKQAADGHPDASGRCTSISTQYRIRVAPAFVVDAKTESVNAPLALR